MARYPLVARIYIVAVVAAGAVMVAALLIGHWPELIQHGLMITAMVIVATGSEFFPIRLRRDSSITVTTVVYIFAIVSFPAAVATAVAVLTGAVYAASGRTARHKALFNTAQYALTVGIAATIVSGLGDPSPEVFSSAQDYGALVAAGLIYFLVNTGYVSLAVALTQRLALGYVWRTNYLRLSLYYLGMLPAGALLALLWQERPWMTPLAVMLAILIHQLFSVAITLEEQTTQALVAMADIIDHRDSHTYNHCQHVARWTQHIGRQLKLSDDQLELLILAARLHDIGKIGMSNEVLRKPGPLDAEEWASVRQHPELGERILRFFPRFQKGLSYIRHHHERYDGGGYPDGLFGEDIPFGARLLCVADSLAAMLDRRPYKPAMSRQQVMDELRRNSAKQFDPMVVGAALAIMVEEQRHMQQAEQALAEVVPLRRLANKLRTASASG